jgi:protein-S-isoprenylcysteine O-methyltransferase Ste14
MPERIEAERHSQKTLKQILVVAPIAAIIGALLTKYHGAALPKIRGPVVWSIFGFAAFSVYWTAAATDAPALSAESRGSRRVHEILSNVGILLILLPELLSLPIAFMQHRFLEASNLAAACGLVIQAGGLLLAIWARRILGQNWSGRIEIKVDHQLVRSGPYRLVRHPIYSAILMMSAGMTIVVGKTFSLAGLAVMVFAYARKVRLEEANMIVAFPGEYDEYQRATWGLLPGVY